MILHRLLLGVSVLTMGAGPTMVSGQPAASGPDRNHFGLAYRMGFNIDTRFRQRSVAPFANNPSITGLSYADGFVGTDSTGNAGGLTSFWGYREAGQAQEGNAFLLMSSRAAGTVSQKTDELMHGLEFTYQRDLGVNDTMRWGLEGAFNYTDFDVDATAATGRLTVDAFPLGYAPPTPPYIGPVNPGPFVPLLGATPTRLAGTVQTELDSAFYGFRLGPYVEWELTPWLQAGLGAGLAFVVADGRFDVTERFTSPTGAPLQRRSSQSQTDVLVGGYVGARVGVRLGEHVRAFSGVQYQGTQSFKLDTRYYEADLDLNGAFYWTLGLGLSF